MTNIINWLKGKKTYFLAALAVIYAIAGFYTGHLDSTTAISTIWAALGAAGLRNGLTTELEKVALASVNATTPTPTN